MWQIRYASSGSIEETTIVKKSQGRFSSSNSKQLRLAFALHIASLFSFSRTSRLAGFAQMQTTQYQKKGFRRRCLRSEVSEEQTQKLDRPVIIAACFLLPLDWVRCDKSTGLLVTPSCHYIGPFPTSLSGKSCLHLRRSRPKLYGSFLL